MSSSWMRDLDGDLVAGRYRLSGVLGRGGMADVYRARDLVLDRDVAVKMLRQPSAVGSERARFVAEARILAGLSHPGLVAVLDAGPDAGLDRSADPDPGADWSQPYVVMELVEGPSLGQVISSAPMPEDEVLRVGLQVAEALAHIHARDIVHRDVKPGNVLLGRGSQTKLADFGIARLLDDTARYTQTGQTIGTAAYLSPEQVTGSTVTGATDIYALGLVLLEAITGRREFPGPATEAAIARLHRSPQIPPQLSWRALLAGMTASDPADRPTGSEVADRLRGLAADPAAVAGDQPTAPLPGNGPAGYASAPTVIRSGAARPGDDSATRADSTAGPDPRAADTRLLPTGSPSADRAVVGRPVDNDRPRRRGTVAVVAVVAVLIATLAVVGFIVRPRPDSSSIPPNTPARLREPLQRLHEAVDGK